MMHIHERYDSFHIINADETNVKIAAQETFTNQFIGFPTPGTRCTGNPKAVVTVLASVTADGGKLPLMFIAEGTSDIAEENLGVSEDAVTNRSSNGWVDESICIDYLYWIAQLFNYDPIVLIWDSFGAHHTEEVLRIAAELRIEIILVPENATSECHPLDIGVFGPVKAEHKSFLRSPEYVDAPGKELKKKALNKFNQIFQNLEASMIREAFRKAGLIYPSPWNSRKSE
jgi:hypothetical protein